MVECLICGEDFVQLGNHVVQAHEISAHDYKSEFGLPLSQGLDEPWRRIERARIAKRNYRGDRASQERRTRARKRCGYDNCGNYESIYRNKAIQRSNRERGLSRRSKRMVRQYRGKRRYYRDWAKIYELNPLTLYSRLYKYGWNIREALETPVR